jgi:hypothetical protein
MYKPIKIYSTGISLNEFIILDEILGEKRHELGMVVHICNFSTQEAEVGGLLESRCWDQLGQHSKTLAFVKNVFMSM